ncbi:MAG TPA: DUF4147 domain-containing protein [Terriglobales bacterium]|nr:DUF4147 domain-containing protein [Terriglobales bacterium]
MTGKIRNREELLSVGDVESRRIVLEVTERVLQKLDSCERIRAFMRLEGDILQVGARSWDLSKKKNIYMFGAGKACNHMARAVSEILGDRLTKGVAIVKIPEAEDRYVNTEVFVGGHPLPNAEGMKGCLRMLELVDASGPDDLFLILISGGSTALMGCPVEGVTLEDEQAARDVMLKSGMRVMDINTVAGHCARVNRGRLGQRIEARGGEIISLNIWDAVGWPDIDDYNEPVEMRGTPVGPDKSTFADIRQIIEENGLAGRLPENIYRYLMNGTPEQETPKSIQNATYFMLNVLQDSCRCAEEAARELGLPCVTLTTSIEGESKDAGMLLATIAHEMQKTGRPFKPPMLIFSAGETTTAIPDGFVATGHGGPSQELTAGFAVVARDVPGACMLSIDSEGSDGTTVMAGGLTDSTTWSRALAAGLNLKEALRLHAAYEALAPLHDCVYTGNTGTNLCDFNVLYVPEKG